MPASNATLASIEPGKATQLLARVYDQNNQLTPNVGVELKVEAVNQSGGHHHGDDTAVARTGTLASTAASAIVSDNGKILTGNTGPNGLQFQYRAPAVSGDININATCTGGKNCTPEGPKQVWVGVKGLMNIPASSVYQLIAPNADTFHPRNHYLTDAAINRLSVLSALYRGYLKRLFPEPEFDFKLYLNDASLERGGIFDIRHTWKRPHKEHCMGAVIDIRANDAPGAIPGWYQIEFEKLARSVGADPGELEAPKDANDVRQWSLRHYHVRLMGQEGLACPW